MMYLIVFVWIVLSSAHLAEGRQYIGTGMIEHSVDTTDSALVQEYRRIRAELGIDSFKLENVLSEWRMDSLTCLGQRSYFKGKFLVDSLYLQERTQEEIVELLGPPNALVPYHSEFADAEREPEKYVQMRYYYGLACKDGRLYPEGACWLEFVIHKESGLVKRIDFICK